MTTTATSGGSLVQHTRATLEMIKVAHSLFALPFALASALLAAGGWPDAATLLWIVVAMVAARSAAMAFNRLVDHRFDARNPRTAGRALPRGLLSPGFVGWFVLGSVLVFLGAAAMLNRWCLILSPVALAVLLGYSFAKRFTLWCHLWLGGALGLAPLAAWIAVRGRIDATLQIPATLTAGVVFWVAGFDLIYACQDEEFDRREGLHSVAARRGRARALRVSAWYHSLAVLCLLALIPLAGLGKGTLVAVLLVALLLLLEQIWSRQESPRRRQRAFDLNSVVGLLVLAGISADLFA